MPLTCLTFSFIQWLLLMDQWSQQQQESSSSFGNMLSGQQQKFQQHQRRRRRSAILPPSSSLRIYYEYLSMIYLIVEYSISLLSSTSILSIKSMYHRKFGCHSHHHDHHRHHSIDHQFQFFHYNQWPNHHCNHHVNNCNYNRINKQSISSKCCFTSIFLIFLIFLPTNFVNCGSHERRLLNDLLSNYNVLERPVANESEVLIVYFSLTLQQIIDVDEKNQNIITNMWLRLEWNDSNLRWSPNDYGGITDLRISPDKVWRPDILLYNSADEKFDGTYHSNVVVTHTGSCLYIPPGIFKSTCKIDITWFPFDDQFCNIKFGSWTYYGSAVDLRFINETSDGDISPYIPNGEWVLLGVPGQRNVQTYECCPEQYIDITYTIGIRRRTLYYGFNLIVPSVIISSMTLLSFTLPPDSGEKLTLGVTILLSMIVFMMQLAEIMPATSDSVSIVGSYFACIMVMVAFSVVMTVVVLNFHHRTTEQQQEMPKWIRKVIITWLPMILRIKKPPELMRHEQANNNNNSDNHISNRNIIIDAANNNNSNNNNNPTMTTSILMTNQYNNNNNRTITSSLSSPTHLELIRLTAKMKEYESLCHKHDCIHRNNKYQQQMSYESMIHSNRQTSGICPWNTFSGHIPPPTASDHIHDHMQQSISPPFNEQSFLNQQPQQQRRHCGRLFETTNPVIHHFDHHHQSQQPQQSLELNPCCCCMCTGTGTHQTIDYFDSIMQELRFITNRYRREDDLNDIISEWKYAAIVIDRLCLIVFSTFAVLSLVICLASAPHLLA